MLLTFDIGNTNITLGAYDGEQLQFTARLATETKRMEDQYAVEIRDILDINGCDSSKVRGAIISSVVPSLTSYIVRAIKKLLNIEPLIIGPGVKTGLDIKIDNPAQLGADLVAVSVAALSKYSGASAVCDLGTATTISVVDKNSEMRGVIIASGVKTSLNALVANTALLQQVSFEAPKNVIGRSTSHSIQSGIIYGTAAMLDGILDRVEEELGYPVTAIATGGLAPEIIKKCRREFIYDDNLVLEGLRLIYMKNR